ncbi:MAG TPA: YfhO family protein, partial [Paludibacteraceae bacterium]|nr:YfhO family protein [Paludibacteraceae bacterium]
IFNKEYQPIINPYANGNAWFVQKIHLAPNADEEMRLLGNIDTKTELVADQSYASILPTAIQTDSTARIELIHYAPNHLIYSFNSNTDQVAIFSEIYYDKGWNAYINGQKVPYIRANYLLRAMPLKAGMYNIDFKFEPRSYAVGNVIALISSIILILCIASFIFYSVKIEKQTEKSKS